MKENEFRKQLSEQGSEVPELFSMRMEKTLERIVIQETNMKESTKETLRTGCRISRRTIALALTLMISLGAFAYAATQWHVFDTFSYMTGNIPVNADSIMQHDLFTTTVDGVQIKILECGYDGKQLFLEYSLIYPGIDHPLGDPNANYSLSRDDEEQLEAQNVGWWIDSIWLNGEEMDMPANSGSELRGSNNPGEIIHIENWRLDNEGITLNGPTAITLPIGHRQDLADYSSYNHPEKYDEDGKLLVPNNGVVTFTYTPSTQSAKVTTEHPNIDTVFDTVTIRASEVVYTPLMTYITLTMTPDAEALAAFKAKNGEGYMDEKGNLLWAFNGSDVYGYWVSQMVLVDQNGQQLFPDCGGSAGYGETWAEFDYPYLETIPDQLYMAVLDDNGNIDMNKTVRIK